MKNKNIEEYVKNLYLKDEYISKNPSLGEEDSPWKVSKIIPLVDRVVGFINKDELNLLDVGGGTGLILKAVSIHIEENHGIKVNKFALDLSPGMLEIQKKRNPDLKRALNEDIRKTSLSNKEIDLALMIDVLEHVPNPTEALAELKRVSHFVIFKVPLEDNLVGVIWNTLKRGEPRRQEIKTIGHVNVYNWGRLKHEIAKHAGKVLNFYFTNVFDYYHNSEYYKEWMTARRKLMNSVARYVFRLSPKLCSLIFVTDFVVILVKCGQRYSEILDVK